MPVLGLLLLNQAAFAEQKTEPAKPEKPAATAAKPATAPQIKADEQVKAALDRLKLKYGVTDRGTYQLVFNIDKRRQEVFVNSTVQEFNGTKIRLVTSTAFGVDGALPADKAVALLADNNKRKLGGWRTVVQSGKTYVVYAVQVPLNADDTLLRTAIAAAMQSADALEQEATGKDNF